MAVRREKVILDLDSNLAAGLSRDAAAARLLQRDLNRLSGTAVTTSRSVTDLDRTNRDLGDGSERSGKQIDRLSGRLKIMAEVAAILGPALLPIGAAAIPALSGVAMQLTLTAAAAGVAVLAFKGMGEGLKALNEYQLEPTAENLAKVGAEFEKLGPDGAHFVQFLDDLGPKLQQLQFTAREGLLPGVEQGITSLLGMMPQVKRIVGEVAGAMGDMAAGAGAGLAGPRFAAFFDYLESDARPILMEMGRTIGNFADGLAAMLVAFAPLTDMFSSGFERMSASFADWAHGLEGSNSFEEFVSYIQTAGPQVADFLGSLVDVFVQIAQAAAPVGTVILPALTALLDVVAALVDSPLGTVFIAAAAAMSVYSRTVAVATAMNARLATSTLTAASAQTRLNAAMTGVRGNAKLLGAGLGIVALSMTDLDEKAGVSNTAMLTLAGTMLGPWGAAAGASVGAILDLKAANDDLNASIERAQAAWGSGDLSVMRRELQALTADTQAAADGLKFAPMLGVPFALFQKGEVEQGKQEMEILRAQIESTKTSTGALAGLLGSGLGPSLGATASAFGVAAMAAADFADSLGAMNRMMEGRANTRDYQAALDNFTASLKGKRAFDGQHHREGPPTRHGL